MSWKRPNLASAVLVLGLGMSAGIAAVASHDLWLLGLLPERPEEFSRAFLGVRRWLLPPLAPLGLVTLVLCGVDMSRASDLRGCRARMRLASVAILIAVATLAALLFEPFQAALREGSFESGRQLHEARRALEPLLWLQRGLALALAASLVLAHRAPQPAVAGPRDGIRPLPVVLASAHLRRDPGAPEPAVAGARAHGRGPGSSMPTTAPSSRWRSSRSRRGSASKRRDSGCWARSCAWASCRACSWCWPPTAWDAAVCCW